MAGYLDSNVELQRGDAQTLATSATMILFRQKNGGLRFARQTMIGEALVVDYPNDRSLT
jgi:hypothetical protein